MKRRDGVVILIEDAQGRILLIRRGEGIARAPGTWALVGGEVEPGEGLAAAAQREVREEVGLDVRAHGEFRQSVSPGGEYLLHWFRGELRGGSLRPHPEEVAEARWVTPAEALALTPMLPSLTEYLRERVSGDAPAR